MEGSRALTGTGWDGPLEGGRSPPHWPGAEEGGVFPRDFWDGRSQSPGGGGRPVALPPPVEPGPFLGFPLVEQRSLVARGGGAPVTSLPRPAYETIAEPKSPTPLWSPCATQPSPSGWFP
jgi:hypothetical protein